MSGGSETHRTTAADLGVTGQISQSYALLACLFVALLPRILQHEIPILDTAKFAAIVGIGPKFGYNTAQILGHEQLDMLNVQAICRADIG